MLPIITSKFYCYFCFSVAFIRYSSANLLPTQNKVPFHNQQLQEFVLNPEKLDILLHTAAIITFLKAKAKSIWIEEPQLAAADKIVFEQCAREANSAVSLARCVVALMRARDLIREQKKRAIQEESNWTSSKGELDWLTQFKKWLKPMLNPSKLVNKNISWTGDQPNKQKKEQKKKRRKLETGMAATNSSIYHGKKLQKASIKKIDRVRYLPGLTKSWHRDEQESFFYSNNQLFSSHNNSSYSSSMNHNREKRRAVNLNHVLQNLFRPNINQLRRRKKHRQQRNENTNLFQTWPSASRSAMRRGMSPSLPWFMEPVMQAVREAKKILLGRLLGAAGRGGKRKVKIGRNKRSLAGIRKLPLQKVNYKSRKEDTEEKGNKIENAEEADIKEVKDVEAPHKQLNNIEKLRRIQKFYQMVDYCNKYMKEIGDGNSRYLSSFNAGYKFEMKRPLKNQLVEELEACLRQFTFENFPILSPKLFSLFPNKETESDDNRWRPSFLSPNLLSFHEEGVFSLPTLFGLVSSNEQEMLTLLDLFMDMAGASRILDKLLSEIEPKAVELETTLYPTILRLEKFNKKWSFVRSTLKPKQRRFLQQNDYTILDENQLNQLYEDKARDRTGYSPSDIDLNLEKDIYKLAELSDKESSIAAAYKLLNQKGRTKRNVSGDDLLNATLRQLNGINNTLLQPPAFGNKLKDGISFSQVVLSPRAFTNTLLTPGFMVAGVLSPSAFGLATLSPRAMVAAILSPTAFTANVLTPITLFGDVLSPKFFHTNILSPRALSALVLSPRTLLFEVLSPKLIELKVLNPNTFVISILGPNILSPRVLSPVNFGISVLSPNIWSPTVLSKGNFTVQVLSPAIMSGEIDFSKGLNQAKKANFTMI